MLIHALVLSLVVLKKPSNNEEFLDTTYSQKYFDFFLFAG